MLYGWKKKLGQKYRLLKRLLPYWKDALFYFFQTWLTRKVIRNPNASINKTFYVIPPFFKDGFRHLGLGNIENHVLLHCIYAQHKGYIPIVDMKNFPSMYQTSSELGRVNVWEKYYEQPCGYTLNDLSKAKKVIYTSRSNWIIHLYEDDLDQKRRIYQKYIRLNADLQREIDHTWYALTNGSNNILGCIFRGTDIIGLNWKNNYPSVDTIISYLDQVKDQYDKIYLATEDDAIFQKVLRHFGDKIIYSQEKHYTIEPGKYLVDYKDDRPDAAFLRGKDYLVVLEMLSRCTAVTGMIGTAASVAMYKSTNIKLIMIPPESAAQT